MTRGAGALDHEFGDDMERGPPIGGVLLAPRGSSRLRHRRHELLDDDRIVLVAGSVVRVASAELPERTGERLRLAQMDDHGREARADLRLLCREARRILREEMPQLGTAPEESRVEAGHDRRRAVAQEPGAPLEAEQEFAVGSDPWRVDGREERMSLDRHAWSDSHPLHAEPLREAQRFRAFARKPDRSPATLPVP